MNIKYPDYKNCIANLACSILKNFGADPPNSTLPAADDLLQKQYKNVVVLLLDGMGLNIMEKHLPPDGFFRSHLITAYSSTFPPTTVAATTAMDSGLFPNQSAWIGWSGYFKEIDRNVFYYWNMDADTGEKFEDMNVAWTFAPYQSIRERIHPMDAQCHCLASFAPPFPKSFEEICSRVSSLCAEDGRKYIYAYWEDPDDTLHKNGVDGEIIRDTLRKLEQQAEELAAGLSDTLLFVTADHGHINVVNERLTDYPDICECLVRMPTIEIRCPNFFVKEEKKQQFVEAFDRHFGKDFILFSKKEVLEKQLFGEGWNHERFESMIGDYLAVGTGNVGINNDKMKFRGHHAGLTEEEMTIPLIAVER